MVLLLKSRLGGMLMLVGLPSLLLLLAVVVAQGANVDVNVDVAPYEYNYSSSSSAAAAASSAGSEHTDLAPNLFPTNIESARRHHRRFHTVALGFRPHWFPHHQRQHLPQDPRRESVLARQPHSHRAIH